MQLIHLVAVPLTTCHRILTRASAKRDAAAHQYRSTSDSLPHTPLDERRENELTRRQSLALQEQLARRTSKETGKKFGVGDSAIRMRRLRARKRLSVDQIENYKRALEPGRRWRPAQLSVMKNV